MSADTLFTVCTTISAIGWIVLFFVSPFWKDFDKFVIGVVAVLLAAVYIWMNVINFDPSILKSFSTLEGVATIFQNKEILVACWAHILCVDLIMAAWIKKNSMAYDIKHIALMPSLIFSYLFGPLGFVIYLVTRWIAAKRYFAENF